jgi:DNA repair exonuclease SbcCD ATPase subunit
MRLPINEKVKRIEFVNFINDIDKELRDCFEISIKKNLESVKIKVMLADFTVIETNTFDPERILNYFFIKEKEVASLKSWKVVPVQSTKTDDLRRIFFQISIEIDNYYFYVYMGIQFHSLLYYKLDKDVISINKKIKELEDKNRNIKDDISNKGDQIIEQELEKLGYKDIGNTELFEELFTKQDLADKLTEKASKIENNFPQLNQNLQLIETLKKDLENFTIELYQINQASIDSNKLMLGEEGIAFNIDFELIKNKKKKEKTSVIDFEKIDKTEILKIKREFSNLINIFKK